MPPADADSAVEPSRLRRWLHTYRYPLTVFVASRLLVYLLFAMVSWTHRVPPKSGLSYRAIMSPLSGWDAIWYHWVEEHGYDPAIGHGNIAAFYPGWPAAWHGVSWLPIPIYLAGSLLATALFGAALCLLYRITLGRYDVVIAQRTVLFMAFWPLAFVFSMPYSESLFLLTSLGAFALTYHRRWWLGCGVGALAVLARPVGIALFPAFAWRIYREHRWAWRAYLPLLLLVAADLAFFVFLAWRTGDFFETLDAQHRGWGRGFVPLPIEIVPGGLGRRLLERPAALGRRRQLHARVVRALVAGVVGAEAARRVPDLRRARDPPALERRLAALDGPDGDDRLPALLGARGVERAQPADRHGREDDGARRARGAGLPHVRHAHLRALRSERVVALFGVPLQERVRVAVGDRRAQLAERGIDDRGHVRLAEPGRSCGDRTLPHGNEQLIHIVGHTRDSSGA